MGKIEVFPTIWRQLNKLENSEEGRKEAYLNLTAEQAHDIVMEATLMLETFMLNYDQLNMDLNSLGGIVRRYDDTNEIVQALLTINKYKKLEYMAQKK